MTKYTPLFILFLLIFGVLSCEKTVAPDPDITPDDPTEQNEDSEDGEDGEDGNYKYTYNFKVRIYDSYQYTNPVSTYGNLDGQSYKVKASFDNREFTISDLSRSKTYLYSEGENVWFGESFNETGIRVEWGSNDDTLQIHLDVTGDELFSSGYFTREVTVGEFGTNYGLNATVVRNSVQEAIFKTEIPYDCLNLPCTNINRTILNSIQSIEIQHPDMEWHTFDFNDCSEELNSSCIATLTLEDLPLDASIQYRIKNHNGLTYESERNIGILPSSLENKFSISTEEITNHYVNATQLPRTVDYFPLPTLGDTLKYIFKNHATGDGVYGIYDFFLIPISISTNNDTTIVYERHMYGDTSPYGGQELNPPKIDTVQFSISNRIINTLEFFPAMDEAVNIFTHYPADAPDSVQYKGITFSKEDGIIGSYRCSGCDRLTKWKDIYSTWLVKDD